MKNLVLLFCLLVSLNCIENQVKIKGAYIRQAEEAPIPTKENLIYKELKICNYTSKPIRPGGQQDDTFDKKLVDLLNEAFAVSNGAAWYNVEIYNDQKSCKILKGYYHVE